MLKSNWTFTMTLRMTEIVLWTANSLLFELMCPSANQLCVYNYVSWLYLAAVVIAALEGALLFLFISCCCCCCIFGCYKLLKKDSVSKTLSHNMMYWILCYSTYSHIRILIIRILNYPNPLLGWLCHAKVTCTINNVLMSAWPRSRLSSKFGAVN